MTWQATLKVTPLLTLDRINDPAWQKADRQMYDGADALTFRHQHTSAPLIVDHDDNQEIGTVTDLWRLNWIDGPWIAATATLHKEEPWLKRGARVSYSAKPYGHRSAYWGRPEDQVITHAFLMEVSVLIARTPAEPLAEVLSVSEVADPVACRHQAEPVEVITHQVGRADPERAELMRRIAWHEARGREADIEAITVAMKRELRDRRLAA